MPFPPKAHEWSDDAWEVWTVEQVNFGLSPLCPEFRTTPVSGTAEYVTDLILFDLMFRADMIAGLATSLSPIVSQSCFNVFN